MTTINKDKMKKIATAVVAVPAAAGFVLLFDLMTVEPDYVGEPAVVRKVVYQHVGFGNHAYVTVGRFKDGEHVEARGDRGESGETILMPRKRGTTSLLGILGNRSILSEPANHNVEK